MAELSESTTEDIVTELLTREDFDGAVITAVLGTGGTYDRAEAAFPAHLADDRRQNVILTAAREHLEKFGPAS